MAKTKLERAIEKKAMDLNEAQREIALAQLSEYRKNRARIHEIEDVLKTSGRAPSSERTSLATERSQLVLANNDILSRLYGYMEE